MFDRSPKPKVPVTAAGRAPDRGAAAPRAAEPARYLAFVPFDLDKIAFGRPGPDGKPRSRDAGAGGRPVPPGLRLDAPPRDPSTQRIVRPAAIKPLSFTPEAIAARRAERAEAAARPPRPNHVGLPPKLKAGVEALSGVAMDEVRVRYRSPEPARLGALAFARGRDIHLGPGQEHHLPHEAWHVTQQARGRVPGTHRTNSIAINDEQHLETEADAAAMLLRGSPRAEPRLSDPIIPAPSTDAPAQLVRGRATRRRTKRGGQRVVLKNNRINSVPEFKRGSTNLRGGRQASHRTAHVVLAKAGRNNLMGATLRAGRSNLRSIVRRLETLQTVQNLTGTHADNLQETKNSIGAANDAESMTTAVANLQRFQELLPGASGAQGSLTAHSEGSHAALLNEFEDRERGGRAQRYSHADVAASTWGMLDYRPPAHETPAAAQERLKRHLVHMKNGWPRTMKAAQGAIATHLHNNHGAIFSQNMGAADGLASSQGATASVNAMMGEDVEMD